MFQIALRGTCNAPKRRCSKCHRSFFQVTCCPTEWTKVLTGSKIRKKQGVGHPCTLLEIHFIRCCIVSMEIGVHFTKITLMRLDGMVVCAITISSLIGLSSGSWKLNSPTLLCLPVQSCWNTKGPTRNLNHKLEADNCPNLCKMTNYNWREMNESSPNPDWKQHFQDLCVYYIFLKI